MTQPKPKHEKIRTWFNLKAQVQRGGKAVKFFHPDAANKGDVITVRPYNAETTNAHPRNVSWSHGFTHFEVKETGKTFFCGTQTFENLAVPVKKPKP